MQHYISLILMKRIFILLLFFMCLLNHKSFSQTDTTSSEAFGGGYAEFNTSVFLSHNIKLSADFDYINNRYFKVSLQPGAEFIWVFDRTPLYDLNSLICFHLLPDADVSLKPFIGPALRYSPYEKDKFAFDLKYGAALYFHVSESFKILAKFMNFTSRKTDTLPVTMGLGFESKIF